MKQRLVGLAGLFIATLSLFSFTSHEGSKDAATGYKISFKIKGAADSVYLCRYYGDKRYYQANLNEGPDEMIDRVRAEISQQQLIDEVNRSEEKQVKVLCFSLCNLCVLCVSVVNQRRTTHHRDTEDTKIAQRRLFITGRSRLTRCPTCR